ncbi:MAG: Fic family protein [bacterium]
MEKLLKELQEKKDKIDSFRPLPAELVKNLNEWFKIELTYSSNAIEGNTLTLKETALVVEKGLTIGGKSVCEHLEAINLAFAIDYIKTLVDQSKQDLRINDILNIHQLILKKIDDKNAGKFRNIAVKIAGSKAELPEPIKVPELMEDYINWLHEVKGNIVKIAADAHLKFVMIHPFVDGNGRTARLLLNLLLMQQGYPPALILKEERLEYLKSIELAQLENKHDDYYKIIFGAANRSLDIYLKAIEKSNL